MIFTSLSCIWIIFFFEHNVFASINRRKLKINEILKLELQQILDSIPFSVTVLQNVAHNNTIK